MTVSVYDKGDLVRSTATFTDSDGAAIDPAAISFSVMDPSGNVDTYAYGDSPSVIERTATGSYYADVNADEEGDWHCFWKATGGGQAAIPFQFAVAPTPF